MNFKNTIDRLSENYIYKYVSPEVIWFYYTGITVDTTKFFKSPFKVERTASFKFRYENNKLFFKDFGASGYSGSTIEFIKLYFSLSYIKALEKVYNDLIVKKPLSTYKQNKIKKSVVLIEQEDDTLIEVILRDYTQKDFDYWEAFHITKEMLIKYDIKPCKEVWLERKLYYVDQLNNPCYRYLFNGKYKIYKPLDNKKYRFLNNCDNYNNIQGLNYLFDSELLVITKSYKDVIIVNEYLNTPSIAFHGETHRNIDSKVIKYLKERYNKIVVIYDNDETGIHSARILAELFELEYNYIPVNFRAKDLSDYSKEYGLENLKSMFKFLINNTK